MKVQKANEDTAEVPQKQRKEEEDGEETAKIGEFPVPRGASRICKDLAATESGSEEKTQTTFTFHHKLDKDFRPRGSSPCRRFASPPRLLMTGGWRQDATFHRTMGILQLKAKSDGLDKLKRLMFIECASSRPRRKQRGGLDQCKSWWSLTTAPTSAPSRTLCRNLRLAVMRVLGPPGWPQLRQKRRTSHR